MKQSFNTTFFLLFISTAIFSQTTIYVNSNSPSGDDGTSWNTAFDDLTDAIAIATTNDEIWVASGTYRPTQEFDADNSGGSDVREQMFYINKNIKMYGGFDGTETLLSQRDWRKNRAILTGEIIPVALDNAYHVLFIDGTTANGNITNDCIIDGFRIENGVADGNSPNNRGGGIYNNGDGQGNICSPTIKNCRFYNNTSSIDGGAIYNQGSMTGDSSPKIVACSFIENEAANNGGAIYNHGFQGTSSPSVVNCTFFKNTANNWGGGIYNNGGQGISSANLSNCSFYKNTASANGGAIYSAGFLGSSNPQLNNCVVWENGDEIIDGIGGNTSVSTSIIKGGLYGAMNADPLFYNEISGDLRILFTSPAIDMGNSSTSGLSGITEDLGGNPRIFGSSVDIGAYENHCPSGIIYVNASASSGGNGVSWATAFQDLQDAINLAEECGGEIWVATGTYQPTQQNPATVETDNRDLAFYIKKNIQLYGGFLGTENNREDRDWNTNTTILNGDIGTANDSTDNVRHILYLDGTTETGEIYRTCIIDGFTIEKANAADEGAGIFLFNEKSSGFGVPDFEVSPTINNCIFDRNKKGLAMTGKITCRNFPIVNDCTFSNNEQGILNNCYETILEINDCTFSNNNGSHGGAISHHSAFSDTLDLKITNCIFENNAATSEGGAVQLKGFNGSQEIKNCIFKNNSAQEGGAIYNDGFMGTAYAGPANPKIINCRFEGNFTTNEIGFKGNGGAIFNHGYNGESSPTLINCSFSNNNAANQGGVMYSEGRGTTSGNVGDSQPKLTNCSVSLNSATNEGDAFYNNGPNGNAVLNLINCTLWDNGDEIFNNLAVVGINSTIIEGGLFGASNTDPLFIDPTNDNLQLQQGSPAIDAGNNLASDLSGITEDLAGNPRFQGSSVDIGAYEKTICMHPDFDALVTFYNSTNGATWTDNTGWIDGAAGNDCDVCDWYGVTCNTSNRVTQIFLQNNNLSGFISTNIGTVDSLNILDLRDNNLGGTLPLSLGDLSNLEYLQLQYNGGINGSIPTVLGDLSKLKFLRLEGNQLTGGIPSSIGNIDSLEYFGTSDNINLGGIIPASLGNLSNLKYLYIRNCQLTGTLPENLGNLSQLEYFWANGNQLTASIPASFSELSALKNLKLYSNNLEGCYYADLNILCTQLGIESTNANISDGNNFDANWEDFCNDASGQCICHPTDPPLNDSCSMALNIPIDSSAVSCTNNATYSGIPPTSSSGSGCGQVPDRDIWFQFMTPNCTNTDTFEIGVENADFNSRIQIELFTGDCNNLTSIDCDRTSDSSFPKPVLIASLSPNTTYYLRVWSRDDEMGEIEIYVDDINSSGNNCVPACPSVINIMEDHIANEIFQAGDTLTSTAEIKNGIDVVYKSGSVIILKAVPPPPFDDGLGFYVMNGSTFHARIEDCEESNIESIESRTEEIALETHNIKTYPNPFSNSTTIEYELSEASEVQFHILDITGRVIETLLRNQWQMQGKHQLEWLPQQQQAGIYFLRVKIGEQWKTRKLMLIE